MSQFTTPKSASTIQTKTWDETSCGMAQTSIIATVMASRTHGDDAAHQQRDAQAEQHRDGDRGDREDGGAADDVPEDAGR